MQCWSFYRVSTPTDWSVFHIFSAKDLFGPGEVFSMETCSQAFAGAPYLNNGSTLDYSVTVDRYDPGTHEAVITIRKIR